MNEIGKLLYNRQGSQLNLSFDLVSMEGSSRTVVGYATLDNIDFGSDIVDKSASVKAFSNFRGNVRLQHDKNRPVGRVLDFQPAIVTGEDGQEYSAIKVAVYISEGAEDVWKMVQDGTLSGFSIGGAVLSASKIYNKELKKTVQVINDYALLELSLVDSPMNGLANVISIHKSLGFDKVMEKDFSSLNLFYCGQDELSLKAPGEECICPKCDELMVNFGNTNENEDIEKSLEKVFEGLKIETKGGHPTMEDTLEKDIEDNNEEKDVITSDQVTDEELVEDKEAPVVEETVETDEVEEEVEPEEEESEEDSDEAEEETEEDAETEEADAESEEDSNEKLVEELRSIIAEHSAATAKSLDEVREELSATNAGLSELAKEHAALKDTTVEIKEKLNSATEELKEANKRLDVVTDGTPIKKSLDSDTSANSNSQKKDSIWKGLFVEGIA